MTNSKNRKRALLISALALLLCCTTLVGTTFAWFTESVSSGPNTIQTGNLDVELEYKTSVDGEWTPVTEETKLFKEGALYEPGYTEVVFLRVSNAGSLALKYNLNVNIFGETTSTNVYGDTFSLKDHLEIGSYAMDESMGQYLLGTMFGTREAALSYVTTTKISAYDGIVCQDQPLPDNAFTPLLVALVLTMPETVGNEANHMTGVAAPTIDLGISLVATQYTDESDSFDNQYDKDAEYPNVFGPAPADAVAVSTFEELRDALAKGGNIKLTANIAVPETLGVSVSASIYGQGYTLNRADEFTGTIFSVKADTTFTAENITLDGYGATATGNLIATEGNGNVVLNAGTVVQNNVGAHAISLATRGGGSLTLNGAQILNNASSSGAIWGGDDITINEGTLISGNRAYVENNDGGLGGAFRMVAGSELTMNGGVISNNTAEKDGGAIWGYSASGYIFNGGAIENNTANGGGGAIYPGQGSQFFISGDFKMINNTAAESGAIRFTSGCQLNMSGGEISGNISSDSNTNYSYNATTNITGGVFADNISISGWVGTTTIGSAFTGVLKLEMTHKNVQLTDNFDGVKFEIVDVETNFADYKFIPAEGYTYTAGDEAKLICMNEGYSTYWDAETNTFKLQATN